MKNSHGDKSAPIWLIGDSPPRGAKIRLAHPLDPRHPTRHSIWTPVWDCVQSHLFEHNHIRLREDALYIRNALNDPDLKPKTKNDWSQLSSRIRYLGNDIRTHNPLLIITFGEFAYRFIHATTGSVMRKSLTISDLAKRFRASIVEEPAGNPRIIPILHAIIARQYDKANKIFTGQDDGNYFTYVGEKIADLIAERIHNIDRRFVLTSESR